MLRSLFTTKKPKYFHAPEVNGAYYISTNDGLYLLKDSIGRQVSVQGGYGIAIHEGRLIRTVDRKGASQIVTASLDEVNDLDHVAELIYEMPIKSSNGRIHQLSCDKKGHFYAALAERNSILKFHNEDGWKFEEFTPFNDRFDAPILFDQNHINSVIPHKDFVLFVAYKAGMGSLIGAIQDGRVLGFHYPSQGVHDIFMTRTGFLCFDTFGSGENGGRPITEKGPSQLPIFAEHPGYILRGGSEYGRETVFGHSHKGERARRFEGYGGILCFREKCFSYCPIPSAQVYQIIREDGVFFDHGDKTFEVVTSQLAHVFGAPTYYGNITYL